MDSPFLSVVIPACNPGRAHFAVVLEALRNQTLPKEQWELIVVDDASKTPLRSATEQSTPPTKNQELIDLSWHPRGRLVGTDAEREGMGLVSARLRGFELGRGDVFVFVDQDNALRPDYLQGVADIAVEHPRLGTWGGQIFLKFDEPEKAPEPWLRGALCTRELTRDIWSNDPDHHSSTPWGAGLCARREVLEIYRRAVEANPLRRLLDPTPRSPGFGGDSDISYAGCRSGFGKGAFMRLAMDHLIPVGRCSDEYLLRTALASGYSTVLHGFVERGTAIPPRNDWRFWVQAWLRRPRQRRLEWRLEMARRAGMWEAVAEVDHKVEGLRDYSEILNKKSRQPGCLSEQPLCGNRWPSKAGDLSEPSS